MNLIQFLNAQKALKSTDCKIHLATRNTTDDPLDIFYAGNFKEWQETQNNKNFERPLIISLINDIKRNSWIFAGIFKSKNCVENPNRDGFKYTTEEDLNFKEFSGRLSITFKRPSRQSYLLTEKWQNELVVNELKQIKPKFYNFPGYRNLEINICQLKLVFAESPDTWKNALSGVQGIYLCVNKDNGKMYIGSATGVNGFWQRWEDYSITNNGGNTKLKEVENFDHFNFSILEIFDHTTLKSDITERESHWKRILGTIQYGYNDN